MSPDELSGFLAELRAHGIEVTLDDAGRVSIEPWSGVEQLERVALLANRDALREVLAAESVEAGHRADHDLDADDADDDHRAGDVRADAPRVYVHGRRVTETDVRDCLRGDSDQVLAAFENGEMSAEEAYTTTATWLKHSVEMRSGDPRPFRSAPIIPTPTRAPQGGEHHESKTPDRHRRRPADLYTVR